MTNGARPGSRVEVKEPEGPVGALEQALKPVLMDSPRLRVSRESISHDKVHQLIGEIRHLREGEARGMGVQVEEDPQRGSVGAATGAKTLEHLEGWSEDMRHGQSSVKAQHQVLEVEEVVRIGCILGGRSSVVVQLLELKATEGLEVNTRVVRGVVDRHGWWGVAKAVQGHIAFPGWCHPK